MDLCKARQVKKTLSELIQYQILNDDDLTEIGLIMLKAIERAEKAAGGENGKSNND